MALETGTYVGDLVITNPTSSDPKSQGDDHLRLIKSVLRESFAGFTGAVIVTGTDGGAADAYTLTPTTALAAYVNRMLAIFIPTATNATTTPTLNISGLGAKTITTQAGAALAANDLSGITIVEYDGTNFRLMSVTKNYVDQLAFNSALPAQAGNTDKVITTNSTVASWTANLKDSVINFVNSSDITKKLAFTLSGLTTGTTRTVTIPDKSGTMAMLSDASMALLATLTPTAAANVDSLNTFTSSYNNYCIVIEGVKPAADDTLLMRFANAGTVDTGSNYLMNGNSFVGTNAPNSSVVAYMQLSTTVLSAGKGISAKFDVLNANDATNLKAVLGKFLAQYAATPSYVGADIITGYSAANAVSGVRFYWNGGSNFSATGKIKIYGYSN